jgi:hypothetical protein
VEASGENFVRHSRSGIDVKAGRSAFKQGDEYETASTFESKHVARIGRRCWGGGSLTYVLVGLS